MKIGDMQANARAGRSPTQDEIRREIVRILGEAPTVRLFAVFAGTTVTFPLVPQGPSFRALARVIGDNSSKRLCERFGGEQVYIPRGTASEREQRNLEIEARHAAGDSFETIARYYGTTAIHVRRIVKANKERHADGRQGAGDMEQNRG